ncbi:MAG: Coenzyme F420 hydrogenase/dehydrogenase, beta subunit C-terminal domain [Candidatus Thorarchaeota archaeon]|jgi:coenzyme F420 hydrogenase subunit beta
MTNPLEKSSTEIQEWLKENTKRFAFKKMEREIIKSGVCVECGACVENCPVDALTSDYESGKYTPTLTGKCIACGMCYANCPRTYFYRDTLLGDVRSAWKAKAVNRSETAQDGGAVTAILSHMIDSGRIDSAVVVESNPDKPWMPVAKIAKSSEEVHRSAGSFYTHAPIVQGVVQAFKEGAKKIAVVGTSCNLDAVFNMENSPSGPIKRIKGAEAIRFGLFCTKSYDYPGLTDFLKGEGIDIKDVKRFAIAGGMMKVDHSGGESEWKVGELEGISSSSCAYCHDMNSRNSDISCGNVGSDEGWTTLLLLTERGEKIFKAAVKAKVIEAEPIDEKAIRTVDNLARFKAARWYKMKAS